MTRVKKDVVEAAALKLLSDITMTMPNTAYKFIMGSMSALAAAGNGQMVGQFLGTVADQEGYVDLDMVRAVVDGGFKASGGKVCVDLFKDNGGILSYFVKPITLTITKEDIDKALAEVAQHAVQDVSLQPQAS